MTMFALRIQAAAMMQNERTRPTAWILGRTFFAEVTVELSTNNKDERNTPQKLAIEGFFLSLILLVLST